MSFKSWSSDLDARTKAKPADKPTSDTAPAVLEALPAAERTLAEKTLAGTTPAGAIPAKKS